MQGFSPESSHREKSHELQIPGTFTQRTDSGKVGVVIEPVLRTDAAIGVAVDYGFVVWAPYLPPALCYSCPPALADTTDVRLASYATVVCVTDPSD